MNDNDRLEKYRNAYEKGKPVVSDAEYDVLYNKLLDDENSTCLTIGTSDGKVVHKVQMTSIKNVYNKQDLRMWVDKHGDSLISKKIDGIAVELVYDNRLQDAILRGDGAKGKSVYNHIRYIRNLVTKFDGMHSVRGELVISIEHFKMLKEKGMTEYVNECSFVAGLFNTDKPDETLLSYVEFIAYGSDTQTDKLKRIDELQRNGFSVLTYLPYNDENIMKMERITCTYPTDGLVIEVNDYILSNTFKDTKKYSGSKIALKPKPISIDTDVLEITYTHNKRGMLIPKATIQPVTLKGKRITKVNLYNTGNLMNVGVCTGATVTVILSGEVIPKIVFSKHNGNAVIVPTQCPRCHHNLTEKNGNLFCLNKECVSIS
jgi:DNA ligase (NAD+)